MSSIPVYAINTSCRSAECLRRWPTGTTAGQYKKIKPPNLEKIETASTQQGRPRTATYTALLYSDRVICTHSFCMDRGFGQRPAKDRVVEYGVACS